MVFYSQESCAFRIFKAKLMSDYYSRNILAANMCDGIKIKVTLLQ